MGDLKNSYHTSEDLKGRDHLGRPGASGRTVLKWFIPLFSIGCGLDSYGSE
jgi:hypothetical protein